MEIHVYTPLRTENLFCYVRDVGIIKVWCFYRPEITKEISKNFKCKCKNDYLVQESWRIRLFSIANAKRINENTGDDIKPKRRMR